MTQKYCQQLQNGWYHKHFICVIECLKVEEKYLANIICVLFDSAIDIVVDVYAFGRRAKCQINETGSSDETFVTGFVQYSDWWNEPVC